MLDRKPSRTSITVSLLALLAAAASCTFRSLDGYQDGPGDPGADGGGTAGASGTAGSAGSAGSAGTDAGPDAGGTGGGSGTLENGSLCTNAGDCISGFCSAGICCDEACDGPCMACTAAAKESGESDGTCGPARDGTDPKNDCDDQGDESCGTDGKCDGAGECRLYVAGTRCGEPTCSMGVKSLPKLCNGEGDCLVPATETCMPLLCMGPVCSTDCLDNTNCMPDEFCDLIENECMAKLADGEACQLGSQCASGFCVDDVCCESECTGPCQACRAELTVANAGVCAPVIGGTDPDDDCADEGATSCGNDGQCNASGACRKYGVTAVCEPASCTGSTQTNAKTCDGAGTCAGNGTVDCSPFNCGASTCLTSCTGSGDCVIGSACVGTTCEGQRANGASCTADDQCMSDHCIDGVCCNTACQGPCKACSAAAKGTGADGVCDDVAAGQDPDDDCATQATSSCGRDGTCDGSGGCRLWASGTVCVPASCGPQMPMNGLFEEQLADTCDGNGNCVDRGSMTCGLYKCGSDSCLTSCMSTADCALGDCITTSQTCYFHIWF